MKKVKTEQQIFVGYDPAGEDCAAFCVRSGNTIVYLGADPKKAKAAMEKAAKPLWGGNHGK